MSAKAIQTDLNPGQPITGQRIQERREKPTEGSKTINHQQHPKQKKKKTEKKKKNLQVSMFTAWSAFCTGFLDNSLITKFSTEWIRKKILILWYCHYDICQPHCSRSKPTADKGLNNELCCQRVNSGDDYFLSCCTAKKDK